MYIDALKQIANNYDYYRNIAANLEKVNYRCQYYDWSDYYTVSVDMMVTIYEFPDKYILNNFDKVYVHMILDDMGFEKKGQDFWNIPKEKRLDYLADKKILMNRSDYFRFHKIFCMRSFTYWELMNKINFYAKGIYLEKNKLDLIIPYLTGAENIDIWHTHTEYHTFFSVKDNSIIRIDCGIAD